MCPQRQQPEEEATRQVHFVDKWYRCCLTSHGTTLLASRLLGPRLAPRNLQYSLASCSVSPWDRPSFFWYSLCIRTLRAKFFFRCGQLLRISAVTG